MYTLSSGGGELAEDGGCHGGCPCEVTGVSKGAADMVYLKDTGGSLSCCGLNITSAFEGSLYRGRQRFRHNNEFCASSTRLVRMCTVGDKGHTAKTHMRDDFIGRIDHFLPLSSRLLIVAYDLTQITYHYYYYVLLLRIVNQRILEPDSLPASRC